MFPDLVSRLVRTPCEEGQFEMKREILKDVSMDGSVVSAVGGNGSSRTKHRNDRLGIDALAATTSPEESLVVDDRCDVRPAQLVETKLTRVLGSSMLPVSHLQMRGLLRQR